MIPPGTPKSAFPALRIRNRGSAEVPMIESMNPVKLRREEEKKLKREAILDAAEALLGSTSWEALNFTELARHVQASRPLIYVYFPTKEELFHALCSRAAVPLKRILGEALAQSQRGIDQIESIGRAYHRFSKLHPIYFDLHAIQVKQESPARPSPQGSYSHPAIELLCQALDRGIRDGSIRPEKAGDLKLTALSLWSFTLGLLMVAARKESFLSERMLTGSQSVVDHGFKLLRDMLASPS